MFAPAAAEEPIRAPLVSVEVAGHRRRATPGSSCLTRVDPATGAGATLCVDAVPFVVGASRLRVPRGCVITVRLERPAGSVVGQFIEAGGRRSYAVTLHRAGSGQRWTARVRRC